MIISRLSDIWIYDDNQIIPILEQGKAVQGYRMKFVPELCRRVNCRSEGKVNQLSGILMVLLLLHGYWHFVQFLETCWNLQDWRQNKIFLRLHLNIAKCSDSFQRVWLKQEFNIPENGNVTLDTDSNMNIKITAWDRTVNTELTPSHSLLYII